MGGGCVTTGVGGGTVGRAVTGGWVITTVGVGGGGVAVATGGGVAGMGEGIGGSVGDGAIEARGGNVVMTAEGVGTGVAVHATKSSAAETKSKRIAATLDEDESVRPRVASLLERGHDRARAERECRGDDIRCCRDGPPVRMRVFHDDEENRRLGG